LTWDLHDNVLLTAVPVTHSLPSTITLFTPVAAYIAQVTTLTKATPNPRASDENGGASINKCPSNPAIRSLEPPELVHNTILYSLYWSRTAMSKVNLCWNQKLREFDCNSRVNNATKWIITNNVGKLSSFVESHFPVKKGFALCSKTSIIAIAHKEDLKQIDQARTC